MKAISLFSGAGGFEIGFERGGIDTVLQAERDPWALEVLARHWPDVERVTDVRDVCKAQASAVGSRRRDVGGDANRADAQLVRRGGYASDGVDLVYGGFPCQDLSVAGKRAGLGGERSGLWFEFYRVLSELRPRWAVIENVPGLLSSNQGRDFAIILDGLDELGFDVGWAVLDAQHFGVPQRRRRVFVVAGPSRRGCEQVLSLCESCGGNPETGRAAREDLAGTLGAGSADSQRGWRGDLDSAGAYIPTLGVSHGADNLFRPIHIQDAREVAKEQNGLGIGDEGSPMFTVDAASRHAVAYTIHGTDKTTSVATETTAAGALRTRAPGSQENSSTTVAMDYTGVRRLTPLECERLMGWPDDHTRWTADGREISDSHRYRMCGNGVVAPVAEWLAHRLVEVDKIYGATNG